MLITCYLREGVVYVPTVARRASGPIYTEIEPISVIPLGNLNAVQQRAKGFAEEGKCHPARCRSARTSGVTNHSKIRRRAQLVGVCSEGVDLEHQR